jgi:DNA-binding transcriptional ArsR family regulator
MTATYDADVAAIAGLIGEPTRAAILSALMSGTAYAAGELARHAGVSPATAGSHLARCSTAAWSRSEAGGTAITGCPARA